MKKSFLVVLLVTVMCFSVFANGAKEGQAAAVDPNAPVTLTVLTTAITQKPEGPLFEEFVAEFQRQHPNVTVELTGVPMNQALQRITTLAASGSLPDIFVDTENNVSKLEDMGICEDLSAYMTQAETANIVDAIRDGSTVNGKLVMYPWYSGPNALIFRQDWLDEAGLKAPATLDEVLAAAQALTKDTNGDGIVDRYGFGLIGTNDDSGQVRFVMILRSFGARELYQDADGNWKTEIGTPESIDAFTYFRDLKTKYGVVPPGALENSFNENVNLMAAEQIGMLIAGSNSVGKIFTANPSLRDKIVSVEMPSVKTTFTPVSILGWSVNAESRNKELAVEFAKFISSKQNSIRWVETTGRLPVMKDALAESEYLGTPLFEGFIAGTEASQQVPNAPFYAEVKSELGKTYQKLMLNPSSDVAAEVKACQRAIEQIIANNT